MFISFYVLNFPFVRIRFMLLNKIEIERNEKESIENKVEKKDKERKKTKQKKKIILKDPLFEKKTFF